MGMLTRLLSGLLRCRRKPAGVPPAVVDDDDALAGMRFHVCTRNAEQPGARHESRADSGGVLRHGGCSVRVDPQGGTTMLFVIALFMAAVGLAWVAVRRKRKAAERTSS